MAEIDDLLFDALPQTSRRASSTAASFARQRRSREDLEYALDQIERLAQGETSTFNSYRRRTKQTARGREPDWSWSRAGHRPRWRGQLK